MRYYNTLFLFLSILTSLLFFNNASGQVTTTLLPNGSTWKYAKGTAEASNPVSAWRQEAFSDVTWLNGVTPFYYGEAISKGTILSDMQGGYATLFLRSTLTLTDTSSLDTLVFKYEFDDGFIIWINGTQVVQRNAPANPLYTSYATTFNEFGTVYTTYVLKENCNLKPGSNQIAVMCFNGGAASSDFYFDVSIDGKYNTPPPVPLKNIDTVSVLKPSGYYTSTFTMAVNACHAGDTIWYTLDGSNPNTSSTKLTGKAPFTVNIDPNNTSNRAKTPAVNFRATVRKNGFADGKVLTRTFIFMPQVLTQTDPNGIWPNPIKVNWGDTEQEIDYDMDPTIVNSTTYKDSIDDALLSLDTYSITTEVDNIFGYTNGIYMNASMDGDLWERPANIELIKKDNSLGYNIDAGIRIRGGYSRIVTNPKHAFRIFFKDVYGKKKLKYALFEEEGTDEFDKFDLRTSQNYSWSYDNSPYNVMCRDVFSRDLQGKMGHLYTKSRFCHLYLDGMYWGIFQTQERGSKEFAASYLKGNEIDFDIIKVETTNNYTIEATDGTTAAWQQVYNMCNTGFTSNTNYFLLQGLNSAGIRDSSLPVLVDIDNLIDYMLIIFYGGNFDSPVSKFRSNLDPNNFYAVYNRNNKNEGFKFLVHDAEHTLLVNPTSTGAGITEDRVNISMSLTSFAKFHPQWLHYKLTSNANYRLRFADHVYKHFFNKGIMTPTEAANLFRSRTQEIKTAIIAESARWGDSKREPPFSKSDWSKEVANIMNNFFPARTNIVLEQLRDGGLYPQTITPPALFLDNQELVLESVSTQIGKQIKFVNNNGSGTIYYTTDGSDPRAYSGAASSSAIVAGNNSYFTIQKSGIIKARILSNNTWSAAHEVIIFLPTDFAGLKISEIHYHPLGIDTIIEPDELEFIEIKNTSATPLNLNGVQITGGITYTFATDVILNQGEFFVIASKDSSFYLRYGVHASAEYIGHLSNGGEELIFTYYRNDTISTLTYNDNAPWPTDADGIGYSIVPTTLHVADDQNLSSSWRASYKIDGSPFADDLISAVDIHTSSSLEALVYPNPAHEQLFISVFSDNSESVNVQLFSVEGRLVKEVNYTVDANQTNMLTLPLHDVNAGIYYLRLAGIGNTITKKIIKH